MWGGAAWCLDRYGLRREPRGSWDAIVVAGCKVMPGGTPSTALRRRVERAVALWETGAAEMLLMTGGEGDNPPSEALVSALHARSMGVPEEKILLEDRSTSTEENARFAAELLGGGRVLVVSDSFHVLRCERVFSRYFDEVLGVGSVGDPGPRVKGALREVAALGWYALRRRI